MTAGPQVALARMELADLPQVLELDRLSFPLPWSRTSFEHELTLNPASHLFVLADPAAVGAPDWLGRWRGESPARKIVGYAGFWLIVDEAHISTIAIRPEYRGQGLGEQLLVGLLRQALKLGAVLATLEVRVSNHVAQNLYRKYGFAEVGRRKHYYKDNGEDALLLTVQLDAARQEQIVAQARALPVS